MTNEFTTKTYLNVKYIIDLYKLSKMRYYFLILIISFICGCHNSDKTMLLCDNEKAFISDRDFLTTAFDPEEPKIQSCFSVLFDTLKSFNQLDNYRDYLCNNDLVDCSGCISLKYLFGSDTIFIPAVNISCDNCEVIQSRVSRIKIYLENDSLSLKKYNSFEHISKEVYSDSLNSIFSKSISGFFNLWKLRKPYLNNLDSLNAWKYFDNSYRNVLVFELADDSQIENIGKYIDIAYNVYLKQLRSSLGTIYQSDICQLNRYEFKAFTKGLFFPIQIVKYEPRTYIAPLTEK
jgi:hypothetical protein